MKIVNIIIIEDNKEQLCYLKKIIHQFYPLANIMETHNSLPNLFNDGNTFNTFIIIGAHFFQQDAHVYINELVNSTVPFIVSTVNDNEAYLAFKANALFCIQKPYTEENIAVVFNKIYQKIILTQSI